MVKKTKARPSRSWTNSVRRWMEIGRRVSFHRKLRGLTQQELADKIGISKSHLSKIEAPSSSKYCSLAILFGIADGLGIDIVILLGGRPGDHSAD